MTIQRYSPISSAISLGLLLIAPGICSAQADSLWFAFDLDVPPGRYSFWRLESLGSFTRLEAELQVVELRRHRQWAPGFTFSLKSGDSTLMVQATTLKGRTALGASVRYYIAADVVHETQLAGSFMPHDTVTLGLDWRTTGVVLVTLGASSGSIQMPFRPKALEVNTSTGEMAVHRMVLTKSMSRR